MARYAATAKTRESYIPKEKDKTFIRGFEWPEIKPLEK